MEMKKILSLFLVAFMMLTYAAYADVTEVGQVAGTTYNANVYIAGVAEANSQVTVLLAKSDTDVLYINQVLTDDKGSYQLKFPLKQSLNGYSVFVRDGKTREDVTSSVNQAFVTGQLATVELDVSNADSSKTSIGEGEFVKATAAITNKYYEEGDTIELVACAYDYDKRLLDCKIKTVTLKYDIEQVISHEFSDWALPVGTDKVKIYAFNNMSTIIPLGKTATITKPVKLYLVSHSQCASYSDTFYPRMGWGQKIGNKFSESVTIINEARSGWSTNGFLLARTDATKGDLETLNDPENSVWVTQVKNKLQPGDYVIISHGTNEYSQGSWDVKDENGDIIYSWKTSPEEYKENLRTFIRDTKSKGANPVLVTDTPSAGNSWSESMSREYVGYMKSVAEETGVPFVDTTTEFLRLYSLDNNGFHNTYNLTPVSLLWYQNNKHLGSYWADNMDTVDTVHYTEAGAELVAGLIAEKLAQSDSELKEYLKTN